MSDVLSLPLPHLAEQFLLRPDVAFLNHGSFGACPRPVFDAYQAWQRELELQPVDFLGRRRDDLLAEARSVLGAYINASPDDFVFVHNATTGVNIVARSLELQAGDEVLGTDHEYGAVNKTWRFLCEKRGARYLNQPVSLPVDDPEQMLEELWAGVTPRTKVICISHITSGTALRFPIEMVCRRAREEGILTIIDGAHAPGQIDLDMRAIGADFYSGNCHKWLCSPKGAGFLYARQEQQRLLHPLVVSHGWGNETPTRTPFLDYFTWTGTDDPAAYLSVPAAVRFQQENNWPAVRAACHRLGVEALRRIEALTGLPSVVPDDERWWSQMVVAPVPACDLGALHRGLWEQFKVEIPCTRHGDRHFVRISIQAYTTPEQIDRLVEGLAALLPEG
ncbi:MAG: aminotransferase class V-fold PLP-dependent enzyme [Chloroflexi bacterium]|nr:aminotransferase class V-fold PLP-dependent enzyme [Chloroflexota bacterium]